MARPDVAGEIASQGWYNMTGALNDERNEEMERGKVNAGNNMINSWCEKVGVWLSADGNQETRLAGSGNAGDDELSCKNCRPGTKKMEIICLPAGCEGNQGLSSHPCHLSIRGGGALWVWLS